MPKNYLEIDGRSGRVRAGRTIEKQIIKGAKDLRKEQNMR